MKEYLEDALKIVPQDIMVIVHQKNVFNAKLIVQIAQIT